MARKFHPIKGEGEILSTKAQKVSKECLKTKTILYIPELRITVYTNAGETKEQTRERYLNKTLCYGKSYRKQYEK